MTKEIKDMNNKELIEELNGIEQHIQLFAYGKFELRYRESLFKEIDKRGIEINKNIIYNEVEEPDYCDNPSCLKDGCDGSCENLKPKDEIDFSGGYGEKL